MKKVALTCASIDCPERKSVCCNAPCISVEKIEGTRFECSKCHKEFIGHKCTAYDEEMPWSDSFVTSEQWVRDTLRKGLRKKSREFYYIESVNRLDDGRYFIELKKDIGL